MEVLLTGGAGFIGSHLTQLLLDQGYNVRCVDDLSTGSLSNVTKFSLNPKYKFYKDKVENEKLMSELIEKADIIYHLAASVGVKNIVKDPIQTIENNIEGTKIVLKHSSRLNKRVFIFSTSEVYGKSTKFPFCEDDDLVLGPSHKLRWSYASSKLIDEHLALAYHAHNQLPVTVIRLFNTIGRNQVGHYGMVVPRFFTQAMSNEALTVYGSGDQSRCFTDVRDVVQALYMLIDQEKSYGLILNIGSTNEISIMGLAEKIKAMTKSSSEISKVSFEEAYGKNFEDMARRVPSTERLFGICRYKFKYTLNDTLNWIYEGLKDNSKSKNTDRPLPNLDGELASL